MGKELQKHKDNYIHIKKSCIMRPIIILVGIVVYVLSIGSIVFTIIYGIVKLSGGNTTHIDPIIIGMALLITVAFSFYSVIKFLFWVLNCIGEWMD